MRCDETDSGAQLTDGCVVVVEADKGGGACRSADVSMTSGVIAVDKGQGGGVSGIE
jgi:hypothetical protein